MGIAGYRQENRMETEDINKDSVKEFRDKLLALQEEKCKEALKAGDKKQIIHYFSDLVNISTHYNLLEEGKTEKEEIRKRASDLFRKTKGKDEYKDLFNFLCLDEVTEKAFTEGILYEWRKLRENLTVHPYPCTLEFLRKEAKDISDRDIIHYFDFSGYENGERAMMGAEGLNVLLAVYRARPSETLKKGIDDFILKTRNMDKFEDEAWEIAKNVAIDVTWELSDPNLDVCRYIFERSGCKIPEEDETKTIAVRYPKDLSWPYGRFNKLISSKGYGTFMYNDVEISKSRGSEETDSVVQFRFAGEGDHIDDNPFETQKAAICNIEKLNAKYADLMAPLKSKFTESVISAIGAYMLEADPSMKDKNQLIKYGRETIKYPVALTPAMIYKWMMADKDVRTNPEIEEDIRKAVGFCNAIWVKMDSIRGSKGKVSITERYLNFSYVKVTANGKTVSGWKFSQVPASVRYNIINGDITKLEMKGKKEKELPGADTKKRRRSMNGYNNFLEAWIKRYDGKGRETLEYGFNKIINEVYDPDIDLDLSENRLIKSRESKKIEKAAEDLKDRGQIRGYVVEIEKKGLKETKKLVIQLLKKAEKAGEKHS